MNEQLIETIRDVVTAVDRTGYTIATWHSNDEIAGWLRALLEENKHLKREIESHGPEGRNYTNEQYVALRLELEQVKAERDAYRREAMNERELSEEIVVEREQLIIDNESLRTELDACIPLLKTAGLLARASRIKDLLYPPREKGADNE